MQKDLEFHLVDHFRILENFSDFLLKGFVSDGFNTRDECTGSIRLIPQGMNNTRHPGKTNTSGTAAGAVQHGTSNVIQDSLFLKSEGIFLQKGILPADGANLII